MERDHALPASRAGPPPNCRRSRSPRETRPSECFRRLRSQRCPIDPIPAGPSDRLLFNTPGNPGDPGDLALKLQGLFFLALFSTGLAGCGYTTKSVFPPGIRTVAVPIFENRSFYRGAERDVTEALIKQIEMATPY